MLNRLGLIEGEIRRSRKSQERSTYVVNDFGRHVDVGDRRRLDFSASVEHGLEVGQGLLRDQNTSAARQGNVEIKSLTIVWVAVEN